MKRILLVAPQRGYDVVGYSAFAGVQDALKLPDALMPPLELATLKALTPPDFLVDIWDESIKGTITEETDLGGEYDLIGATGYYLHIPWALRLCEVAHRRGMLAVIGGPGVSGAPDMCRGVFDVVFIGEGEFTWPEFLTDWSKGKFKPEYRQVQRPELDTSPVPDWTSFENMGSNYLVGAVQTTRGCPFDCDFCDVIHLFGRQPRHKSVAKVLEEVAEMQRRGMRTVFFCDDNFIGRPKYARELLRELIPLNNSFERPIGFSTQLTINIAEDDELLEMMADANFHWVLIGIESPRESSLREANKPQNMKIDLVECVRKIQSHGIFVKGNMIVGFDHDDAEIFPEMQQFLRDGHILNVTVSMLKAFPGTPLLARLQTEGRVIENMDSDYIDHPRSQTNIIPKQMSRVELFGGYDKLLRHIHSWEYAGHCARNFLNGITRIPKVNWKSTPDPKRAEFVQKAIGLLPADAQAVVREVVATAFTKGPLIVERMVSSLFRFAAMNLDMPRFHNALKKRIEIESSPMFAPRIVRGHIPVPPDFLLAIQRQAFPTTFEWLQSGMKDPENVTAGLIEVWKSFLIRWSMEFQKIEDYHMQHLRELCERTIEQEAAGRFANGSVRARLENLTSGQLRRLCGEVLVSVEQDLRGRSASGIVQLQKIPA